MDKDANLRVQDVGGVSGTTPAKGAMCRGREQEGMKRWCRQTRIQKGPVACKLWLVSTSVWLSPAPDHRSLSCLLLTTSVRHLTLCPMHVSAAGTQCQLLGDQRERRGGQRLESDQGCGQLWAAVLAVGSDWGSQCQRREPGGL